MRASWDLDAVTTAFTNAAIDPARWNAAMEVAADVTGGFGAALFPVSGSMPNLPQSLAMADSFETYLREGWIHHDERYRGARELIRRGVVTDFDFITEDEIARHPFYQEFLARMACAGSRVFWLRAAMSNGVCRSSERSSRVHSLLEKSND